ncbi:hypothetical protein Peur_003598 [Populus x canadensis]
MSIDTNSIYDYDPLGRVSLTYLLVRKIKIIKFLSPFNNNCSLSLPLPLFPMKCFTVFGYLQGIATSNATWVWDCISSSKLN